MRRPSFLVFALRSSLLLIALASAVGLGAWQSASCAMHGLGAARVARAPMVGTSHSHHTPAPSHERAHDPQGADHSGCDCTCIGDCTMVAPLATPPVAATLRVALIAPAPRGPLDIEPTLAPPAEPDGLLPFANGPPATALL